MSKWKDFIARAAGDRVAPTLHYDCDLTSFPDPHIEGFCHCDTDEETQNWLMTIADYGTVSTAVASVLRKIVSRTAANGLTGRGGMHIFSQDQLSSLLQRRPGEKHGTVLDIGAGDGGVTDKLRPFYQTFDATEYSTVMQWRLWWKGYKVRTDREVDDMKRNSFPDRRKYDLVCCLNVLDRCDRPWTLLQDLRKLVKPGTGQVLLTVVLPWCPFVEKGTEQHAPTEILPMEGGMCRDHPRFETAAQLMMQRVIEPAGFKVVRWTRLPYLCEGSPTHYYYMLDDLVMVLEPTELLTETAGADSSERKEGLQ